jgi:hypothetical protein
MHRSIRSKSGGVLLWALVFLAAPLPAWAEVAVVAGSSSGVPVLTREQVVDIYLGRLTTLPGGVTVIPLDLPEDSPARHEFYNRIIGKSAAQLRAYWAKMTFTGRGTPPKEVPSSAELKRLLVANPNMLGYLGAAEMEPSLKKLYAH